jgi:GTP-binding protein
MTSEEAGPARGRAPVVAIVGRQNVGKSSLINRLLGSRRAIANEEAGVTRDRIEIPVTWAGRTFVAVDTGGFVTGAKDLDAQVVRQAERAMAEADLILLVVDAVTGIQEEDALLASRLHRADVPVVLVANKVDSEAQEPEVPALFGLGLGEPMAVSALHGRGSGELLDRIVELLPEAGQEEVSPEEAAFAIVGRPNVGKSSLFNRLVGDERAVVAEEAGTTRDAVDSIVEDDGGRVRFVDTAGFRRPHTQQGTAYYSFVRTVQAIDRSDVACLVVDASEGLTTEDRKIAARAAEAGKGLVVVANKWDLVPKEEREERFAGIKAGAEITPGVSVLRTSALTGAGVGKVLPALRSVREAWVRRAATAEVNRVLQEAQGKNPPPRAAGRVLYGTQVAAGPPRFVVFSTGKVPQGYVRFLENRLRQEFGFDGVPVKLKFRLRRRRKNG